MPKRRWAYGLLIAGWVLSFLCLAGTATARAAEPEPTGCLSDAWCPSGMVCEPAGPSCNVSQKICVPGCRDNQDCFNQTCVQMICATCPCPGVCTGPPPQDDPSGDAPTAWMPGQIPEWAVQPIELSPPAVDSSEGAACAS